VVADLPRIALGTHAWIQDMIVFSGSRHLGIGSKLLELIRETSTQAGLKFLHVNFEEPLGQIYFQACGFRPTAAGIRI
jgi:N-acetylglutamate synthase-like GNAT family acetyltransferase